VIENAQQKLQEAQLTASLIKHLASKNSTEKIIAIKMLRKYVPSDTYTAAIVEVVGETNSEFVSSGGLDKLKAIAKDDTVNQETRDLASQVVETAGIVPKIKRMVEKEHRSPISFGWNSGDPNPDCNTNCRADLIPNRYAVNPYKDSSLFVRLIFNSSTQCNASPDPNCVPACDSSGTVAAMALVKVEPDSRLKIIKKETDTARNKCFKGTRGEYTLLGSLDFLEGLVVK
jgi:hypothetical protein